MSQGLVVTHGFVEFLILRIQQQTMARPICEFVALLDAVGDRSWLALHGSHLFGGGSSPASSADLFLLGSGAGLTSRRLGALLDLGSDIV